MRERHPADRTPRGSWPRPELQHEAPLRREERPRQGQGGGPGDDSPERDRPVAGLVLRRPRERLGPHPVHFEPREVEPARHVAQEVGPAAVRLHEPHGPLGAGELHDQPGGPGPAPDVEEGARRLGQHGQQQQRLEDEMLHLLGRGAIPRQVRHGAPPAQRVHERSRSALEARVEGEAQRGDVGRQARPEGHDRGNA